MTLTITLKPELEIILKNRAVALGYNIDDYVGKLIEEDSHKMRTLDEIFAPFRKNIEASGISEEELDNIFTKARKEVFAEKQARLK